MNPSPGNLGELIRAAGRRTGPDAATLERLRAAAHASWQARLAERRQRQRRVFAMAASVLAVVAGALLTFTLRNGASDVIVASVIDPAPGVTAQLHVGDEVLAPPAGMALARAPDGATSLRLAGGTRIRWRSPEDVELLSGRLYVDTGRSGDPRALRIAAAAVQIEHVGTQFMTERFADRVQVSVRDGQVRVSRDGQSLQLVEGETGVAAFDTGRPLTRSAVALSGPEWDWAEALAPHVVVEGRSLQAVLADLAYESGLPLRFASRDSEAAAANTLLHGPAIRLPPRAALRAVLATTQLQLIEPAGADEELLVGPR